MPSATVITALTQTATPTAGGAFSMQDRLGLGIALFLPVVALVAGWLGLKLMVPRWWISLRDREPWWLRLFESSNPPVPTPQLPLSTSTSTSSDPTDNAVRKAIEDALARGRQWKEKAEAFEKRISELEGLLSDEKAYSLGLATLLEIRAAERAAEKREEELRAGLERELVEREGELVGREEGRVEGRESASAAAPGGGLTHRQVGGRSWAAGDVARSTGSDEGAHRPTTITDS
ncbi:MAG: hypothetical protein M1840_001724 [Geoglossum simile]|nr:MAG: hypothetical protein M1840_001724 [Geoglossum simile]